MYNKSYFSKKRKLDPDSVWIPGILPTEVIKSLMKKLNTNSYLEIDESHHPDIYIHLNSEFDIIYITGDMTPEDLYECIKKSLNLISDRGYVLVDYMFPYYKEFEDSKYKAFIKIRQDFSGYQFNMLWDCSYGLGVIRKGEDQHAVYNLMDAMLMDYETFEQCFTLCMNTIDTELFLHTIPDHPKYLYSVLTCIFNDYEVVREVPNPRSDVEYVMVTDNKNLKSKTWKIIHVDEFFDDMSGYAKAFYVKYHPFEFVESDTFIWIDGSIQILNDFTNEIMMPFIKSNYELIELVNTITNKGDWELDRWFENRFHGFDKEQYELSKKIFENEKWLDETQAQTTIYACKNTRLMNLVNSRTWDIMHKCAGPNHDIVILYMPQRGKVISKYLWNSHKVYWLDSGTLFSPYFDYCYHKTTVSQKEDWYSHGNKLSNEIWGRPENPIYPKKIS